MNELFEGIDKHNSRSGRDEKIESRSLNINNYPEESNTSNGMTANEQYIEQAF